MTSSLIVCVVMVIICASGVNAQIAPRNVTRITCYQCEVTDPWCVDPFPNELSMNKSLTCRTSSYCFKAIGTTNGKTVVTRRCLFPGVFKPFPGQCGKGQYEGFDVLETVCFCDGNFCNAATLSAASSSIVMTLAAATAVVLLFATRRHY